MNMFLIKSGRVKILREVKFRINVKTSEILLDLEDPTE